MNLNQKKTILYIEDDPNNRLLIKLILEKNGYKFFEAEDGLKGIDIVKKQNIDLILIDINMQGMNGYETATRIKSFNKYKNKPLIALSANIMKNTKDLALIAGCDGFIKKPINASNIVNQIEEYLKGKKEEVKSTKFYELLRKYNLQLVSHLEMEILELQRANNELKEIDKLKSDFISLASHEIKTPLTSIAGFVKILLSNKKLNLTKNIKNILKEIKINSAKLENTFNDILTISCLENNIPFLKISKNVSIVSIIKAILDDISNMLQKFNLKINLNIVGDIPLIECDIDKIYLAISNIIKYSINEITNNLKIDISLKHPSKNIFKKFGYDPKNFIELLIEYKCKNITFDKLNKIFDKFVESVDINKHTSDNEYLNESIGLSLSISQGIINRHNGYIWVEKKEDNSIIFIIVLPYNNK